VAHRFSLWMGLVWAGWLITGCSDPASAPGPSADLAHRERPVPPGASPAPAGHADGGAPAADLDRVSAEAVARLRAFEDAFRATVNLAARPTSDQVLGADPVAVAALPGLVPGHPGGIVGVLRGAAAIAVLDRAGREHQRLAAPAGAMSVAVHPDHGVLVAGGSSLARYRLAPARGAGPGQPEAPANASQGAPPGAALLAPAGVIELDHVRALRDIAIGPGNIVYAVEEHRGRWLALALAERADGAALALTGQRQIGRCHGPTRIEHVAGLVLVSCLLDHALAVLPVDERGQPTAEAPVTIAHDGPLWSFAVLPGEAGASTGADAGGVLVAMGGVEDHPLVRSDGEFGHIDSFVFLYRLTRTADGRGGLAARRVASVNVSELGVVTPKHLALTRDAHGAIAVHVSGYGSDRRAVLSWPGGDVQAAPRVAVLASVPGIVDAVGDDVAGDEATSAPQLAANPLLDAWVLLDRTPPVVIPIETIEPGGPGGPGEPGAPGPARSAASRVGEALFFTTLMAPWNPSDGAHSRFTCETCHFEGYGDGRVHHSGRGDVRVATKPLLGLAENRPHFSRALDSDMAVMVHNEFRVANRGSGRSPWFALSRADAPWLAYLEARDAAPAQPGALPKPLPELLPEPLPPLYLRQALMTFLMDFTHRPNPARAGRDRFTARERHGAAIFRDRCEDCHRAQLAADEPGTRVPFADWERMILAPEGAIVWADAVYVKTGVTPYAHPDGTRVPSLRRLYKKYPYFTSGSARSLPEVLDRAAVAGDFFYHDVQDPPGAALVRLDAAEKQALLAFLDLL
jgi:hypothetical protein